MIPAGPDVPDDVFALYRYYPSFAGAAVFAALFVLATLLHLFQLIRTRAWFVIPFLVGGFLESAGYIGRAVSARQTPDYTLGPYVIQSVLLLVAPALFAATIYMELGRIVRLTGGELPAPLKAKWLTKIFVSGDVLSFLIQSSGAGILVTGTPTATNTGQGVIIGGLLLQAVFFGLFLVAALVFHSRISRTPTERMKTSPVPWRKHLAALYLSSGLILVRSVFRVVEYAQGNAGYLLRHECFLYVFDAGLMLAVMIVFGVVHPSEVNALIKGGKAYVKGGFKLEAHGKV